MRTLHLLIILLLFTPLQLWAQQGTWKSANGPLGADATAFYIDGSGNYWLGTGSSGGVYRSTDKGKSWEVFNGGIGTAHVSWIGVLNGQLHIEVADEDSLIHSDASHPFRLWSFQGGKTWAPVADEKNDFMVKMVYETSRIRYESIMEDYKPTFDDQDIGTDKEGFINSLHPREKIERPWASTDFSRRITHVNGLELPNDVYTVRGWNFYRNENNELIVLGKTNVYVLKGDTFVPMGKEALQATDVSHTVQAPDGRIYAISNYRDLYMHHDGGWTLLFNGLEEGPATDNGVSSRLNLHPDGKVITVLDGDIYSLHEGELKQLVSSKLLLKQDQAYQILYNAMNGFAGYMFEDDTVDLRFSNAAYDKQGQLWAYGEADSWGMLVKIDADGQIVEAVHNQDDSFGSGAFIASNPISGDLWFFTGLYAQWLDQPEIKLSFHLDYSTGHYGNLIAFSKDGKMAFPILEDTWKANFRRLFIVSTDGDQYSSFEYHVPLESITSLGFDNVGNLYAGTGYQVVNPRDLCGWGMSGKATGLYLLGNNGWQQVSNTINPWILSLNPSENGLWVGTSGSGVYHYDNGQKVAPPQLQYVWKGGKEGLMANDKEVYPVQYHEIIPYEDYYKIHGYEGSHPYAPEVAPQSLFALQESEGGLWRLGNLEGTISDEAFHGFFHTSTGGLLGYRISNESKGTRAYWQINTKSIKLMPLPYAKIYTFEKGYVVQHHDNTYRVCNNYIAPISRQPFKSFKQINHQMYLGYLNNIEVWDVDNWSRERSFNFKKTGQQFGHYLEGIDQSGYRGIINTQTSEVIFHGYFDSLKSVNGFWICQDDDKIGLYKPIEKYSTNIKDLNWQLPLEQQEAVVLEDGYEQDDDAIFWGGGVNYYVLFTKDGKKGVYDITDNKWGLEQVYSSISYSGNGRIWVIKDGLHGIYNLRASSWDIPLAGQTIESWPHGIYKITQEGKVGLFSTFAGGWEVLPNYDDITPIDVPQGMSPYYITKENGLLGLISPLDEVKIYPAYKSIELVMDNKTKHWVFKMYISKKKKNPELHTPVMGGDFEYNQYD